MDHLRPADARVRLAHGIVICAALAAAGCTDDLVTQNNGGDCRGSARCRVDLGPGADGGSTTPGADMDEQAPDTDGDGLSDGEEQQLGTDPNNPDSDGDGLSDSEEVDLGTDPNDPDSDDDGALDGSEALVGSDPKTPDESCGLDEYSARLEESPVDIIFVIDNSGSMKDEIESVERNINASFSGIIGRSGADYRVIMVTQHGEADDKDVCISEPLSGTDCTPVPSQPVNAARFFHYDQRIGSHDAFEKLLDTIDRPDRHNFTTNGWSEWLRAESFKHFILITDDEPHDYDASSFYSELLRRGGTLFGDAADPKICWHSIIGMAAKADPLSAYTPADPLQSGECPDAVDEAIEYQKLSRSTGGLRYPVCEYDSYDAIFEEVATGIIDEIRLQCELTLPDLPDDLYLDEDAMILEYRPGGNAAPRQIRKVSGAAACAPDSFYFEDDTIKLCPTFCDEAQNSTEADLSIHVGCTTCVDPVPEICGNGIDDDCDDLVDFADVLDCQR